jgi:hypothetical protein
LVTNIAMERLVGEEDGFLSPQIHYCILVEENLLQYSCCSPHLLGVGWGEKGSITALLHASHFSESSYYLQDTMELLLLSFITSLRVLSPTWKCWRWSPSILVDKLSKITWSICLNWWPQMGNSEVHVLSNIIATICCTSCKRNFLTFGEFTRVHDLIFWTPLEIPKCSRFLAILCVFSKEYFSSICPVLK